AVKACPSPCPHVPDTLARYRGRRVGSAQTSSTRQMTKTASERIAACLSLLRRGGLHHVRAYLPLRLVALLHEIPSGGRVHVGLRLVQAVPLRDCDHLGSLPNECHRLSAGRKEIATTPSLDHSLNGRRIGSLGCGIEHFDLTDEIGFRFGLSVQSLH